MSLSDFTQSANSQPPRNRTLLLIRFETILMHAERLSYEIQDILYGNA